MVDDANQDDRTSRQHEIDQRLGKTAVPKPTARYLPLRRASGRRVLHRPAGRPGRSDSRCQPAANSVVALRRRRTARRVLLLWFRVRPSAPRSEECVARYSKLSRPPLSLVRAVQDLGFEPPRPADGLAKLAPRQRVADRITDRDVMAIVAGYERGLTTRQLADRHGLGKTTVQDLLHEAGVALRKQPLATDEVVLAASLYRTGLTLGAVAHELSTHPSTIWRTLTRAGIKLRPRGGYRPPSRSRPDGRPRSPTDLAN